MKGRRKMKKIKKLTIILTIVLLSLISFIGIYVEKQNVVKNIVKDYDLAMNLEGYREVRMTVADKQEAYARYDRCRGFCALFALKVA